MSSSSTTTVGIMGSANIAKKGWGAMNMAGLTVGAVASRSAEKAQKFIDNCQALKPYEKKPEAVEGYEALLARPDCNAVYVPLPTMFHAEWVVKALEAGKNVVVEKPVSVNNEDLANWQKIAKSKGLSILDGTMLTHGKRIVEVRKKVASGEIGSVSSLHALFTFPGDANFQENNIRVDPGADPLGAVGDVGWYCIRYAQELFPHWTPVSARGFCLKAINTVNVALDGEVVFDTTSKSATLPADAADFPNAKAVADRVTLRFHTSFLEGHTQNFRVIGTEGTIGLDDFCLPVKNRGDGKVTKYIICKHTILDDGLEVVHTNVETPVEVEEACDYQETMLWRNLNSLINNGGKAEDGVKTSEHFMEITWKTQAAVNAAWESSKSDNSWQAVAPFPQ